ncbi:hypothetical protein L873DRAFT_1703572 [Choiromyces venosus 120613-1]|uniref:Uncharacterized protein n=1 Tax=Choiromyces venosus 120613-1 TaxID=1336337 RepID=A0A3N4JBJ1_9PEZI|nr:hypothetical protein L873DRAFT_1703572 [Choiromyces venosus 120613-1]
MEEFTPKPVYPTQCLCPTEEKFVEWVRQEIDSFGGGSTYLDFDIFNIAEDIISGLALEGNIVAFNAVIAWRAKKQEEIIKLVRELVDRDIIPESVAHSPIQLLPISKEAFENRMILIKFVPELLDMFEIPDTKDELQTKFNAPLYWFAIVLARARHEAPFKCELKKVLSALVDMGIAKVPDQWGKEEWISKMTVGTELEGETLYIGMDEVTKYLPKKKPYFGWRLPPYGGSEVSEKPKAETEAGAEAELVVTECSDVAEEFGDLAGEFASYEGGKNEEVSVRRGEGGAGLRALLRDILFITLIVLCLILSRTKKPLPLLHEVEAMVCRARDWTKFFGEEILMLTSRSE